MPTMGMERSVHSSIVTPAGTFQNVVVVSATASFVCVQKNNQLQFWGTVYPTALWYLVLMKTRPREFFGHTIFWTNMSIFFLFFILLYLFQSQIGKFSFTAATVLTVKKPATTCPSTATACKCWNAKWANPTELEARGWWSLKPWFRNWRKEIAGKKLKKCSFLFCLDAKLMFIVIFSLFFFPSL